MKIKYLLASLLLCTGMVFSQSQFSGGGGGGANGVAITTVAGLANVPGKTNGTIAVVTDGSTGTSCTVGGGANLVACQFNGTTWSQLPAASAGATAFSAITGGTNAAALIMGTGGSLATSGSGTISATSAPLGGISGLGTGVGTFLGTPTSANLAGALTDETGSGAAVFGTSPVLTTPNLGTPSAINLTNATGFPATVVLTNQANTFSTGLQSMSAADYLQPVHVSDPATCTAGQIEFNSTSASMKFCSATNTWTALGTSGGSVTSFSSGNLSPLFTTSVGTPSTTPALSFTLSNAAANTILSNFTGSSAAPAYNTINGGVSCGDSTHALSYTNGTGFGCQAITASSVPWSSITNPVGNLALTMGSNTSTFNTTTAVSQFFKWANTTAAVVGTSQSSPILSVCGTEFHAAASAEGCLALQFVPGTGTDAANTFAFTHTGSATGTTTTTFPGPIQAGSPGGVGGTITLPEGTAPSGSAGNDVCYADSTAHAVKCSFNNGSAQQVPLTSSTSTTTTQPLFATATAGVYAPRSIATGDLPAIPLSGLATQAADTVVANASGSTAAPTAVTIGSCSTATSALTYNTTTHAFGCNSITGGSSAWSSLTNAASDLTLNNAGFNSTFTQNAADTWTWQNTTASTVSVPQNSPSLTLAGTSWNGASRTESWSIQSQPQAGSNTNGVLNIAHVGTSGNLLIQLPNSHSIRPNNGAFGMAATSGSAIQMLSGSDLVFSGINNSNAITTTFGDNGSGTALNANFVVTTAGQKDVLTTSLKATAALTSGQVVKIDTANANSVVVAATTDTAAGAVLGFVENAPGAGAIAFIAIPGSIITDPLLGTGTCSIGNFVIVDTTTAGRVKCTATFTAGTVLGRAITAQASVGSAVSVYVQPL